MGWPRSSCIYARHEYESTICFRSLPYINMTNLKISEMYLKPFLAQYSSRYGTECNLYACFSGNTGITRMI